MNIALVQLGRIGDLVLLTTAIKPIKKKFPTAKIFFITGSSNYSVLLNNDDVENILIYDKNPFKLISFIIKLKSTKLDYYIDTKDHYSKESAFLASIANAKIKIGFNAINKKKVFDVSVQYAEENSHLHFVERIFNALKTLNIEQLQELPRPQIILDSSSKAIVQQYLSRNNIAEYFMINISASNTNKMWLTEKWIELINQIKQQIDIPLIISSEAKHSDIAELISNKTNISHFPSGSLQVVSALIANAKLLLSPDTSLIHIAASFDIPVISLANNIPSEIIKFRPLSSVHTVILSKEIGETVAKIEVAQVLESIKNNQ